MAKTQIGRREKAGEAASVFHAAILFVNRVDRDGAAYGICYQHKAPIFMRKRPASAALVRGNDRAYQMESPVVGNRPGRQCASAGSVIKVVGNKELVAVGEVKTEGGLGVR